MGYKSNSQLDDDWVGAMCIRTILVLNFVFVVVVVVVRID